MKYRITSQLIALTYEAALKSFWRRNALKKFLMSCNISEKYLNTWTSDVETKRVFLDRLFLELQKNDKGKTALLNMAFALIEQKIFPDLKNWEDSDDKIKEATIAVTDLKEYLDNQAEKIITEEKKEEICKKAFEESIKIQREITDKQKLRENLDLLATELGTQEAGYKFQYWFYSLLDFCEIEYKKPYIQDGRQIDGSLTLDGTTYLVELKFTSSQSDATDIDSIKAKIDNMADNTMGIMISMSGYSNIALTQASGRKTTILLMDSAHLYYFLTGSMEFKDIILRIRRHASQTGESYLSVQNFSK
jgi:hypothetical protein